MSESLSNQSNQVQLQIAASKHELATAEQKLAQAKTELVAAKKELVAAKDSKDDDFIQSAREQLNNANLAVKSATEGVSTCQERVTVLTRKLNRLEESFNTTTTTNNNNNSSNNNNNNNNNPIPNLSQSFSNLSLHTPNNVMTIEFQPVIPIYLWDSDEMKNMTNPPSTNSNNAIELLYQTTIELFKLENPDRNNLRFYYLTDPNFPLKSRQKINTLSDYRQFRDYYHNNRGSTKLILYITKDNQSPMKDPVFLTINTKIGPPALVSSTSSPDSSLSPDYSPDREKFFREEVLLRDFDEAKNINYCVLCSEPNSLDTLVAAHLYPHAKGERLGFTKPLYAGHVHSLTNGVSSCSNCHTYFDNGYIWVEMDQNTKLLTSHVHDSVKHYPHLRDKVHLKPLRIPVDPKKFAVFPNQFLWEWRQLWAEKKRKSKEEKDAEPLNEAAECSKCNKPSNKQCKNEGGKFCATCCKANGGCTVKSHRLA